MNGTEPTDRKSSDLGVLERLLLIFVVIALSAISAIKAIRSIWEDMS